MTTEWYQPSDQTFTPDLIMVPSLLTHIARQKGFPSNQPIKDTAKGIAIADEWAYVWRYTEAPAQASCGLTVLVCPIRLHSPQLVGKA